MGWNRFGARAACAGLWGCLGVGVARATPVTVTIDRVLALECFDDPLVFCQSEADFYAVVNIGGPQFVSFVSSVIPDDDEVFPVDWVFTFDAPSFPVPITIQIFDEDSDDIPPDDEVNLELFPNIDVNPVLDLQVSDQCDISGDAVGTCGATIQTSGDSAIHRNAEIEFRIDALIDTDGDGLADRWELDGVDGDGDGVVDVVLPGADPHRKNIYVEVDFMTDHEPPSSVFDAVVDMFASAPVQNPDGSTGVDLTVVVDDEIPHTDQIMVFCDADPSTVDFADLKLAWFGTEVGAPNVDPAFVAAMGLTHHYAIFAHEQMVDAGGKGEIWGDDFAVTLGGSSVTDANGHAVGSEKAQSGAFAHELGHNLGLEHSGQGVGNCKPNYVSIMSYSYAESWIPSPATPLGRLDYSSVELPPLDESVLDEPLGVGDGTDGVFWADANGVTRFGRGDEPLDWDGDGAANDVGVVVDLNDRSDLPFGCPPSPNEVLVGAEDWSGLLYDFQNGREFGECVPDAEFVYEPTSDERFALRICTVDQTCEPKLLSFWQDQCTGADSTEIGSFVAYADCVAEMPAFSWVQDDNDVCLELLGGDSGSSCDAADTAYLALLLNRCSERVPLCCLAETTVPFGVFDLFVDDVIERADGALSDPLRTEDTCDAALGELELIGTGTGCGSADLFGGWDNGTLAVGNVDTGTPDLLATTNLVGITAVTWDHEQGALLVATGQGSDELWRVPVTDGVAGEPELVGALVYEDPMGDLVPLTDLQAMEIAPEIASTFGFVPGDLYAVALDGPVGCDTNCGYFVDKNTAIAIPAAKGLATEQLVGLSFDPVTGELWAYDDGPSRLYTLDAELVETAGASVGGCVPGAVLSVLTASTLGHDCSGRMFTVDTLNATLVEIDPLTGCGTIVGERGSFRGKKTGPVRREGLGLDGGASR